MAGFDTAGLEEIEELDGHVRFRPIRRALGITTFGSIATTARAAGDRLINEHDEDEPGSSEELYVVMSGHATFELDGEQVEAPTGTFVRVDPGVRRTAFARDAGTTILAVGAAAPGKPYEVIDWEISSPMMALYEAGEYAQAADLAVAMLEQEEPEHGGLYYNTACFESRAGRIDDAIGHLRRGVELTPSMAELARTDDDLAAVRERPEFAEIVGG